MNIMINFFIINFFFTLVLILKRKQYILRYKNIFGKIFYKLCNKNFIGGI
jgi:hypothetical protein